MPGMYLVQVLSSRLCHENILQLIRKTNTQLTSELFICGSQSRQLHLALKTWDICKEGGFKSFIFRIEKINDVNLRWHLSSCGVIHLSTSGEEDGYISVFLFVQNLPKVPRKTMSKNLCIYDKQIIRNENTDMHFKFQQLQQTEKKQKLEYTEAART